MLARMRRRKWWVVGIAIVLSITVGLGCWAWNRKEVREAIDNTSAMQALDQESTIENFERLYMAVPPPQLTDSQERRNLVKRLERFNASDKISYIYLVSFGKIMAHYVVKGKVSSVNSMLTCTDQLVNSGHYEDYVQRVASPDLDGSYGSNGDAIFFFTDQDIYVEWNGAYMLCDAPLKLEQPPELILDVTQ